MMSWYTLDSVWACICQHSICENIYTGRKVFENGVRHVRLAPATRSSINEGTASMRALGRFTGCSALTAGYLKKAHRCWPLQTSTLNACD